jgi:Protein of unknown function (DUF2723)
MPKISARPLSPRQPRFWLGFALAVAVLLPIYFSTMLIQIGGGLNAFMDDVAEIQTALNLWGTVHMTGYPLFTVVGNAFVGTARVIGIPPAVAPALHSMAWGFAALAVLYALLVRLTGKQLAAALAILLIGLIRSVWAHQSIAEVYSLTLFFVCALLAIALWPGVDPARRVWLLALVGGFGVAHHRMVAFMAPGLLVAALPPLLALRPRKRAVLTLLACFPTALIGFAPYIYLPLRAQANAAWVYGNPVDVRGLWHEFTGAEVDYLLQPPVDGAAWQKNITDTFRLIPAEMTIPFAVASVGALLALIFLAGQTRLRPDAPSLRWAAWIAALCLPGYFLFLFILHRAVMPEAVSMNITVLLGFVVGLALAWLAHDTTRGGRAIFAAGAIAALAVAIFMFSQYRDFVLALTRDPLGEVAKATALRIPERNGVLMLPWGPRHTAVGFSKYVTGENASLTLLPHTAQLAVYEAVYTFSDTFYRFPEAWWMRQLDGRVYMRSAALGVVKVSLAPEMAPQAPSTPLHDGVVFYSASACRTAEGEAYRVNVLWGAAQQPTTSLSVFVHLRQGQGTSPLAQGDQNAPVYGWRPTNTWLPGELIRDDYAVSVIPEGQEIAVGMYAQQPDGSFVNYPAATLPTSGLPTCPT